MKKKPKAAVSDKKPYKNPYEDCKFFNVTPQIVNEVFEETCDFIWKVNGLKLSIIELFHLRKIAHVVTHDISLVLRNASNVKNSMHVVSPWQETAARFFLEYYGIPPYLLNEYWEDDGLFNDYLKKKQAEYHLP